MKIKNKIKNIYNLTKIFSKNSFFNFEIYDKKTNKFNKKSLYFWIIIILVITLTFFCYKIMEVLGKLEDPSIFLNIFLLIVMILNFFQVSLISTNVYFYSKDIELILPLPVKPEELLISKFITILKRIYLAQLIFALSPLIIYGIYANCNLLYYFYIIIIFFIFPILPTLIVSIIMMFLMKFSKIIKNKEVFQILLTLIFLIGIFFIEFKLISAISSNELQESNIETKEQVMELINNFNNKIRDSNKYLLQINPSVDVLKYSNLRNSIIKICKIILMDTIVFILFIFSGKKRYLRNLLKNNNYFRYNKKVIINYEKKCKKNNKIISYIIKEFRNIYKNSAFFIKCIFPQFNLIISTLIIFLMGRNTINTLINEIEIEFNLNIFIVILSIFQIINNMSNIAGTSFSREGQNAIYMKFLPIEYYKQFVCKIFPQIFINFIISIFGLFIIKFIIKDINFIYLIYIFIVSNLLNIFNSQLMGVLDLYKPNLNWKTEFEVMKQENNKLFQYTLTVIIVLVLTYFNNIFENLNFNLSAIIIIFIFIIINTLLNIIIKKNIKKLFRKIN